MERTNKVWGKLRDGQALSCARCYGGLGNAEAYLCQDCRAIYGRACLSVNRRCACGSARFSRYQPPQEPRGLFKFMLLTLKRVIHGS